MTSKNTKSVYIIAGPNGSGKTTFALNYLPVIAGCRNFINADLLAHGLSPLSVDTAAMQAGRLFLKQIALQITLGVDFAFETTLSGLSYVQLLGKLRQKGYRFHLYFLWVPEATLAIKRVAQRVKRGGHHIPNHVIKRRYQKGIFNLFHHYLSVLDYVAILDNTSAHPKLIYEKSNGHEKIVQPKIFSLIKKQANYG